jgi:hypothetical protein
MKKTITTPNCSKSNYLAFLTSAFAALLLMLIAGCSLPTSGASVDEATLKTQMALEVQMTLLAEQSSKGLEETAAAQQETLVAQAIQMTSVAQQSAQLTEQANQPSEPTPDQAATQNALAAEGTASALQLTQQAQPTAEPPAEATQPPTEPAPTPEPDVEAFLKSASILLYEDMAGDFETTRYIKETLDSLGLNYVDTKDAIGRFREHLLSGGPDGEGWDIVIAAAEIRTGVRGEMFDYLNEADSAGSSVVLETWIMDSQAGGKLGTLLGRCGVEFMRDWSNVPTDQQVIFPLEASHPLLHDPNDGIQFRITNYWALKFGTFDVDLGDLMRIAPGSEAVMVLGTRGTEKNSYAVLAVCENGRFIIQSFPTHGYRKEHMTRYWENILYFLAKARMDYLAENQ